MAILLVDKNNNIIQEFRMWKETSQEFLMDYFI